MKYPCLVKEKLCKTEVHLELAREGLNKYGSPFEPVIYDGKCNYQDKAKTILTDDKQMIKLTGTALFPGDIAPELPVITGGSITVFGNKRRIYEGIKARNPDGTVNYTEIRVM